MRNQTVLPARSRVGTSWLLLGSAVVIAALGGVDAQEDPAQPTSPPAAPPQETVPQSTPETTTQQTRDPAPATDDYAVEREAGESGSIMRMPAEDDSQTATEPEAAGEYDEHSALKDAWLDGKLEAAYALNRHLNPFTIDTSVEDAMVVLSGHVESEIDRELAGDIAQNIEGVTAVRNDLIVQPGEPRTAAGRERTFAQRIDDATTTATVKSKLLIDGETQGLRLDVDTLDHVVTLSGDVDTAAESDLAEQIASNIDEVERVQNELRVVGAAGQNPQ
ncbi:MAG: BON domain-containing protein [Gammaproteobacteria bacterium]|nr:BON domain-containing protein [Gammaproteobacteria bacterium]